MTLNPKPYIDMAETQGKQDTRSKLNVMQGLFGTKMVHKIDSLVSINRQHELYMNNPQSSWLDEAEQVAALLHAYTTAHFHTVLTPLSLLQGNTRQSMQQGRQACLQFISIDCGIVPGQAACGVEHAWSVGMPH